MLGLLYEAALAEVNRDDWILSTRLLRVGLSSIECRLSEGRAVKRERGEYMCIRETTLLASLPTLACSLTSKPTLLQDDSVCVQNSSRGGVKLRNSTSTWHGDQK